MLDLGANADCTPEHLFQFAVMGSVVATGIDSIVQPRIALLNIGEEEIKGNETVHQAARAAVARASSTTSATSRGIASRTRKPTSSCATASRATWR